MRNNDVNSLLNGTELCKLVHILDNKQRKIKETESKWGRKPNRVLCDPWALSLFFGVFITETSIDTPVHAPTIPQRAKKTTNAPLYSILKRN